MGNQLTPGKNWALYREGVKLPGSDTERPDWTLGRAAS